MSGHALLVSGVAASGKSTLALAVARALSWTLLDLDTMTNPLFEHAGGEAAMLESNALTGRTAMNAVRYRCLIDTARENLAIGNDTVLVAPFTSERASPRAWQRCLDDLGVPPASATLVWLDVPADVVLERKRQRCAARDLARLARTPSAGSSSGGAPAIDHVRVDGTRSLDQQIADVVRVI